MIEEVREALMRLTMCAREECGICKHKDECGYDMQCELATQNMNIVLNALESRPKGKWIRHQAGLFDYHYCSICEEQAEALQDGGGCELLSNYCPNCGAEMESE